jgi:hypothetical protein
VNFFVDRFFCLQVSTQRRFTLRAHHVTLFLHHHLLPLAFPFFTMANTTNGSRKRTSTQANQDENETIPGDRRQRLPTQRQQQISK